jgi:methylmalonyl-CoA epimerase
MSFLRRLDHVAIAISDTEAALVYFRDRLGLPVTGSETIESPHVRLTYLEAGGVSIQLVESLDPDTPIAHWIAERGEGLHHICFEVDDALEAARRYANAQEEPIPARGEGWLSAFSPGDASHGVRVEFTTHFRARR